MIWACGRNYVQLPALFIIDFLPAVMDGETLLRRYSGYVFYSLINPVVTIGTQSGSNSYITN